MTAPAGIPRVIRWTVALGLIGLALTVPFSAPDGTGMQWDELVLACVAGSAVWSVFRLIRAHGPPPPPARGGSSASARRCS